jgi:tetratricopeptide (TPR) repeat protein
MGWTTETDDDLDIESELEQVEELSSNGRRLEVVERCTRLLEQFPDEGRLYFHRAHARNVLRDTIAALDDMTRAAERMPDEPAAAFFCGLWCLETGGYANGVSALARALELEERLGSTYYATSARFLGALAHAFLGEFDVAEAAIRVLPENAEFYAAGKLWTLPQLRALVARGQRP